MKKPYFDKEAFAEALTNNLRYGDTLRAVGRKIGVSASTLSRIKSAKNAHIDTILILCDWMDTDINKFVKRK